MGYSVLSLSDYRATHHSRIEHPTMTRLNPPMGFTSQDWSEETLDWSRHAESGTDWVQVVNEFISRCDHLYKTAEPESELEPELKRKPRNFRTRVRSRASSRASSRSEGHVSPEDDGPSKKVVHYDD